MAVELDGRRQRTVVSREAIIEAAADLFSARGFHDASLRSISAQAGMSHSGLLKHFSTKAELLVAVLQKADPGDVVFDFTPSSNRSRADLVRMLVEHTMQQTAALTLRVVLLGEAADVSHPAHEFVRAQLGLVEFELGVALDTDGAELLALWNGLQLIWRYVPDLDPVRVAVAYADARPVDPSRPLAATSALPRPHPLPVGDSRESQIVAVATEAFAHSGYRSSSLREIAAQLGLSHGTVLYHFPTKVALLTAVLDERDREESLPWTVGAAPLDYLNGMYLQALHNEQNPGLTHLFSTLVCEAIGSEHPAHAYFADRYVRFHGELTAVITALVADGTASADIDAGLEAWTLIALWDGLALRGFYQSDDVGLPERLRSRIDSLLTVKLNHTSVTTG